MTKKILILGSSPRSLGGEALLTAALKALEGLDVEIYSLTFYPKDDLFIARSEIKEKRLKLVRPRKFRGIRRYLYLAQDLLTVLAYLLAMKFGLKSRSSFSFKDSYLDTMSKVDIVMEIPGIIFVREFGAHRALIATLKVLAAKLMSKKYVYMPHSSGPTSSLIVRWLARLSYSLADLVLVRGRSSMNFVLSLGVNPEKVLFIPDMAFSLDCPPSDKERRVTVVPNLHLFRWLGEAYVDLMSDIVEFIRNSGYEVILVPHEYEPISGIDDLAICRRIYAKLKNKKGIKIVDKIINANEAKEILGGSIISVVSRYHAMISSLLCGIPPVVIGWAEKYRETLELFNIESLAISYNRLDRDELIEKVRWAIDQRKELSAIIQKNLPQIQSKVRELPRILEEVIYG